MSKVGYELKFRSLVLGTSVVFVLLILSGVVYASWSSLGSGYAVTSNVHGINILPGTPVTVTAGTLDPDVTHVRFVWHQPRAHAHHPYGNGDVRWEVVVEVFTNGTTGQWTKGWKKGTTAEIRYAQNTQIPDVVGDWGVKVFFQDSAETKVIAKKATSFNVVQYHVVPEIPLGTVGAAAAMAIALGLFAIKKKGIPRATNK